MLAAGCRQRLRYGENPHQQAAFYATGPPRPRASPPRAVVQGKELSYNNLADADAALALAAELDRPGVAIIKHANPCGVAVGRDLAEAYAKALACDPTSAFGGIVACNRPIDGEAARAITQLFTEVVVAPGADAAARAAFAAKPNLRLLLLDDMPDPRRRRPRAADRRRRPPGPGPRRRPPSTRPSCARSRAAPRARPSSPTSSSPGRSSATSARTRSCWPATVPPSASAPAR